MKKFVKFLFAIVAIAAIATMGLFGTSSRDSEMNLTSLMGISDADAECVPFVAAHGKCISLQQVCVFDVFPTECDPYYLSPGM